MNRLQAVVLSAGAWSRASHLPAMCADENVELVAVSSPDPGTAEEIADMFNIGRWETDWRKALTGGIDIAVVSSPPVAHEDMVVEVVRAGAHVLVEKPFALNVASAIRMRNEAMAADRHLLVGFGWPAAPVFARARAWIEAGEIGPVEHMNFHLAVNTRALLMGGSDGGWGGEATSDRKTYTDPHISAGGAVVVSMSHQLGLVEWLTGNQIAAVQASTFPAGAPIDLHATVNVEFSGGGSGAISCASTHPYLARPQWHMALYGGRGQIWLDSAADHLRLVRADGEVVTTDGPQASGLYDAGGPTRALIACAQGVDVPGGLDAKLATRVVAVTDAIYQSARTGAKLQINTP